MWEGLKISTVIFLLYFPFFFLVLIPSNSIFLRPHDLYVDMCTKLPFPYLCEAPSTTLAIIKPDGMAHEKQILDMIKGDGFKIKNDKRIEQLSLDQVSTWYFDKQNEAYYPSLVTYLQRGPVRVLTLERIEAVPQLRQLIGPTDPQKARHSHPRSVRALYGINIQENAIHASDSLASVERESDIFFQPTGRHLE